MTSLYNQLIPAFNQVNCLAIILVDISQQQLLLINPDGISHQWPVSTAQAGSGNQMNSYQTPLGAHVVSEKIGNHEPECRIFKGRKPTGELATIISTATSTHLDQVTSRILWLKGLEHGINLGPGVDTRDRYIYIHGTNEEGLIGQTVSHGCIRMRNHDVIDLFERVEVNTPVYICESQNVLNLV